jgi:tRNA/rRNA methyltransferase
MKMNLKDISIILVQPQMGENIGATARVMKNFGFSDLRIISPRDGWPNAKAHEMSANADDIIEGAKLFDSIESAVADINILFATASKPRDMLKEVITPEEAANIIYQCAQPLTVIPAQAGIQSFSNSDSEKLDSRWSLPRTILRGWNDTNPLKIGFLFGKESSGLDNEDVSHCNYLISIPVAPEYDSLNLSQAVCVVCYEVYKLSGLCHSERSEESHLKVRSNAPAQDDNLAERKDLNEMIKFLDKELTEKNFFQTPDKKPGMMNNIRNIFTRHFYTEQEVRTLRGIFNALKK